MQITQITDLSAVKDDWYKLFCRSDLSPFQSYLYTQLFTQQFIPKNSLLLLKVIHNSKTLALATFEKMGDFAVFVGMKPVLGKEEITDYGDIVVDQSVDSSSHIYADIWIQILAFLKTEGIVKLVLDYVREDSPIYKHFHQKQYANIIPDEVAPWIRLDQTWDEYLSNLARVDRKELRRKLKRLETMPCKLIELDTIYKEDFDEFIRQHRLSDSAKEKFMSEQMANFFWQVSQLSYNCWHTKLWFLEVNGKRAASAIGFVSDDRLLMYNSGFDPEYGYYSVGLLNHALIMQKYMGREYKIYDFMRGSERYKYDLGAVNEQLYRVEIKL